MPKGSTRISKALSNLSVLYKNSDYIAGDVLKDVYVMKDSDNYWVYNSDFRLPETLRANGSPANMVEWGASTATYSVFEHAVKDVLTETDYDNTDAPLNLDKDTVEYLTDKILLRQEYECHKLLFTTTTFSNNATLTSVSSWKYHTTTSAPIQNMLSATGKIIEASGKKPNKIVMGWDAFEALKENPNMYDRIKYVQKAMLTEDILASLFEVDKVHVGTAVYDSNKEGETESINTLWGADCLIGYFDPSPGLRKVTSAVNFRVRKKGAPFRVKKWYEEDIEGNFIEVQTKFKPKAVATACAYLYKSVAL